MVVLWMLGILLALILLLLLLRVGMVVSFGERTEVTVKAGPVHLRLLPRPEKKKAEKKKDKKEKAGEKKDKPASEKVKGSISRETISTAIPVFWEALKKALAMTRRRIKISPLSVSVVIGGDDPADAAILLGKAEAVMWTVMPQLERLVRMPDPHIHLEGNFNGGATKVEGTVGASCLVWDLTVIGLAAGVPVLKWFLKFQKGRVRKVKQSAENAEARARAAEQRLHDAEQAKQTPQTDARTPTQTEEQTNEMTDPKGTE